MVTRLVTLAREAGFRGLFAGLGPRMIMTAGLVSGQFLIYGEIKHSASNRSELIENYSIGFLVLGAPPGLEIHKEDS